MERNWIVSTRETTKSKPTTPDQKEADDQLAVRERVTKFDT